jgi:hypothetical protein
MCLQQAEMKSFQEQNRQLGLKNVMLTIFFASTKLVSLNALPPGERFTQDYFINTVLTDIVHERCRFCVEFVGAIFLRTWTIPCATMVTMVTMVTK